jgi:hypothetical protein
MSTTAAVVGFYCACSGGMLVLNKLAVHHIRAPALVTLVQFATTTAFVTGGWQCGCLPIDQARWSRLKHFALYVLAFSLGTWANMKVLMAANVETVIVFRSCAPLCMCIMDYAFHGRALPGKRSVVAMLVIAAGAAVYVAVDRNIRSPAAASAYVWVGVWFGLLLVQLTYGKQLVTGLGLQSSWSPVLYTNAMAVAPTAAIGALSGDFDHIGHIEWTSSAVFWLVLSCIAGVGISWAGFKCQALISATAYTVVGVMNKLLTVLINVLIWDK